MSEPLTSAPSSPSVDKPGKPAAETPPPVFRLFSKQTFGWVCNVLATVLVLTAGLIFAQQVLFWWHGDEAAEKAKRETMAVMGADALATPGMPLDLELGDWPCRLRREEFSGDKPAALAELRRLCQESVAGAAKPVAAAGPAEVRMLAGLTNQKPFAELPGGWQLYEQDGPVPLVAAVHTELPATGKKSPAGKQEKPATSSATNAADNAVEVAPVARRVVSWGLGVRLAGTRWTLMLLTAQAKPPIGDRGWAVLLPPGAKRSLSLAAFDQESIVAFAGSGPREAWQQFYDKHLASIATSQLTWRSVGEVWQQRYETATETIEVVLAPQAGTDEIQGLLTIRKKLTAPPLDETK